MTAFRHWRLVYHNVESGGVRAEAAEIEMRLTAGGGDETGSGTPSASSAFEAVANAFDNDTGTRWRATTFDTAWIAYDFGVSNEKAIVELSVRVNTAASGPEHLRVDASTDGSTWVPQAYFFDLSWGASETKVLTFGPLPPPLRITVLSPTTITVAAPYSHPAAAQESVQWQLEDETGDFSTPLQDTGEISTDLTSHAFSSLTGQTVYQVRCRQKEEDNSTWSDWSLLYVRTPEFINGERNDFDDDTLGSAPGGWTDHTAGEHVVIDDDTFFKNKGVFQNRHFSGAKVLASANNPTWSPTSDEMHWSAGPEILNQRIVALAQLYDGFGEVVIGGRWDATGGQGYLLWFRRDTGDNEAFLRGPGGAIDSDVAAGIATSTWQWVVLEVLGSAVQAKWWPLGTAEPGSFQLSGVDAGFTDPGFAWINGDQIGVGRPIIDHIQVEHLDAQVPDTPVLTLDDFDDATAELSTDAFGGGSGVHMDSQWQVAIDSGFVTVIRDVLSDVDLEAHIATGLPSAQPLWARVRWRDDGGQPSEWSNVVNWTSSTNPGCGDIPTVIVGGVTNVEATLSTDPVPAYIETHFQIRQGTTVILEIFKTGGDSRFFHTFSGLTASIPYTGYVRVRRTCGFSPWSTGQDFVTLAVAPPAGSLLGCPPAPQDYLWNSDANPSGFEHWRGTGWYVPYPGEPLRGVVQCKLRMPLTLPPPSWDIDISDDLGVTYVPLVTNLDVSVTEGDGLEQFSFMLDTTILADGMDYRLRATDGPTVVESLSFAVDNASLMASFANRDFSPEAGRFGIMWCTRKTGGVWGDPVAEFPNGQKAWWQNSISRDIIALRGHPWSAYVDRDLPTSLGGDVTVRFYLWSGEGGFRGIQGAVDLEGWSAGIGFFVDGISETASEPPLADAQTGIFVGLESLAKAQGYGCCDDYYTMPGVAFSGLGRANQGVTFAGLRREDDGAKNSASMATFPKLYGNSWYNIPNFEAKGPFALNFITFRQGHLPGVTPERKETCGRRYSVYTVRARVEVDPGDHGRVRIRARCDGPGATEPSSGYWHYDKWHLVRTSEGETDYTVGALGLASKQFASTLWGAANGGRNFVSWSALPLNPGPPVEVPPDPLLPFAEEFEGRPCTLILQAYEADRETLKWEVGTDRDHIRPYLAEPEHYGEQEIDIIAGAATIGQVDAIVVDVAQTPGDQDSGWMTERLTEGGVGVIHARRFRLRRFVSVATGWVTIADGPAGTPRLDPTYSAYRWEIRDTRETERKVRAFTTPTNFSLYPVGPVDNPWGEILPATEPKQYLLPLVSTGNPSRGTLFDTFGQNQVLILFITPCPIPAPVCTVPLTQAHIEAADLLVTNPENFGVGGPLKVGDYHYLRFKWRLEGDDETQWREFTPQFAGQGEGDKVWSTGTFPFSESDIGDPITAISIAWPETVIPFVPVERPPSNTVIEFQFFYAGPVSENFPFHVDGVTAGEFLINLYDGVYSPLDPITGEIVPTGIRYDPEALLLMTDPVTLRITEPVNDARDWAETHIYAPTGWVPALDNDLRISPKSQIPPLDFSASTTVPLPPETLLQITDAITEPVPNWDAGEFIVNYLQYVYPRYYIPFETDPEPSTAIDGIKKREIRIEFRDEDSITAHNEQKADFKGDAFAAIGGEFGEAQTALVEEVGNILAELRRLYVFERYKNGAQAVFIPVRRDFTSFLRPGDWVVVDLSWIPDYLTKRREGVFGGQILSIKDLDCAWRVLLIEEALPVIVS